MSAAGRAMTTTRAKWSALAVAALIALAGCSDDRPHSGRIIDKAASTNVTQVCSVYIKGQCASWTPIYTKSYQVTISSEGGSQGTWGVSSDEYEALRIGDEWRAES